MHLNKIFYISRFLIQAEVKQIWSLRNVKKLQRIKEYERRRLWRQGKAQNLNLIFVIEKNRKTIRNRCSKAYRRKQEKNKK